MSDQLYQVNTAACPHHYQPVSSVPEDLTRFRGFVEWVLIRSDGTRETVATGQSDR